MKNFDARMPRPKEEIGDDGPGGGEDDGHE